MKWFPLVCLLCWSSMLWGHGKEKHEPKIIGESGQDNHSQNISSTKSKEIEIEPLQKDFEEKEILHAQTQKQGSRISLDEKKKSTQKTQPPAQKVEAADPLSAWVGLDAFPTLHPMVVHLPVVLLPFALLLFVIEWQSRPEKASLSVIISAIGGALGAITASFWLHPHVESLSREALTVLEAHDFFAYTTTGLASSAAVCLGIRYFRWNHYDRKWWTLIVFILLSASSITVAATGHLGATLSHVHEVKISSNHN